MSTAQPILGHSAAVALPAGAPSAFAPHHKGHPDYPPEISRRQFNFAVGAAGGIAAQEAQAQGIDPLAVEAMLSQSRQIGPAVFAPVSMQTLLALQLLMKRRASLGAAASPLSSGGHDGNGASTAEADEDDTDLFALAEAVLVFADPLAAARMLMREPAVGQPWKAAGQTWEDCVLEFSGRLLPADLRVMGEHINHQMALLQQLGGGSEGQVASHPQAGQVMPPTTCP